MATSVGSKYRGPWFSYPTRNELIAAATVLPALACLAVVLRFTVRARQKAGIRVDDWLTLPAAVSILIASLLAPAKQRSQAFFPGHVHCYSQRYGARCWAPVSYSVLML